MKRILISVLLCIVLLGCVFFLLSCGGESGWLSVLHTFTYEVTGITTRADITYQNLPKGDYIQIFNKTLPWSIELFYSEPDDMDNSYYLSARNITSAGSVIVSVYIDGILEKAEQTIDPFGFVAIYGTTP